MSRRAALAWAAVAAACLLLADDVVNNYDTAYSLLWGRDLAEGTAPDLEVELAPTPHPLATLFGLLLSLPGRGSLPYSGDAMLVWNATALLALAVLGVLVFALARHWFGAAAGVVAALVVLTREPVLSFGLRAYLDLPYLCLLLAAVLVEARRPRAGTPVLVLIGLAGLLRPEAWLFAGLYAAWLWRGDALRARHVALAAAAPVLWVAHDLALTGEPLWSLTGTRENADALERVTGLDDVPVTLPRRLGEILREPVLLAALGGLLLAWRRRLWLPLAAGVAAVAAFCVLAAAGLPILTRYLLLPAALLAILAAGGATAWARGRPWAVFTVVCALAFVAFAPAQADRLDRLDAALDRQQAILVDLRSATQTCPPLTLPNRRAIPQTRLWSGLGPEGVRSAQDVGVRGSYIVPRTLEIARDFVLDPRDRDQRIPAPPSGGEPPRETRFWRVFPDCGLDSATE